MDKLNASQAAGALKYFYSLLETNPENPEVLNAIGLLMFETGEKKAALGFITRAIELDSDVPEFFNNRGIICRSMQMYGEAIWSYNEALRRRPDFADALFNLGNVMKDIGRPRSAAVCYEKSIAIKGESTDALFNLGVCLHELGRLDAAERAYAAALKIEPGWSALLNNSAMVLLDTGRYDEARVRLEKALQAAPSNSRARFNLGVLNLLYGDMKSGWAGYEARRYLPEFAPWRYAFDEPQWRGEEDRKSVLLIRGEQGFGDMLQFFRFVHTAAERVGKVIVECRSELVELFSAARADCDVVPIGADLPPYDCSLPMMSLPHVLGIDMDAVSDNVPYLGVSSSRCAGFSISDIPGRLKVGLAWKGNRGQRHRDNRSIPLAELSVLFDNTEVEFYSLQPGGSADECEEELRRYSIYDAGTGFRDFADTAEAIRKMDLVISVDTAVAHLVGAMGKPVWVMLPFPADWRWLLDREDSPWYPTARLFRQSRTGDWAPVVAEVNDALKGKLSDMRMHSRRLHPPARIMEKPVMSTLN